MAPFKVQSIAIIGAGPAGIAAVKYFLAEKAFKKIVIFEQRDRVGGVWNYTPDSCPDSTFSIPQTNPSGLVEDPLWSEASLPLSSDTSGLNGLYNANKRKRNPIFTSPLYETLETNIPKPLMRFDDKAFQESTQLFPRHESVLSYLEEYANDIRHLIEFETQVRHVDLLEPDAEHSNDRWNITTRNLATGKERTETYDALIVANGHYNLPYIPDIEGIREWNKAFPGSISHSKYFRRADAYADKKVIVVGNSASGIDIGSQVSHLCASPLIVSSKSPSYLSPATPVSNKIDLPPISSFDSTKRQVRFTNGHVESSVDCVIFCTGYFYSYPFLSQVQPPLIGDGTHVENTYLHFIYTPHPTLALLALPQKVIPFPVAQAQAAVLARLYSDRLALPSFTEMKAWEEDLNSKINDPGEFHVLQFPKDADYINELHTWAARAERRDKLENDGMGKQPPWWGEWERWCRSKFVDIRKAFGERGEDRRDIRTLTELGFVLEDTREEDKADRNGL